MTRPYRAEDVVTQREREQAVRKRDRIAKSDCYGQAGWIENWSKISSFSPKSPFDELF